MIHALKRRMFLVALVTVLAVGVIFSEPLKEVVEYIPRQWIVAGVLLAMALPLRIGAMWEVIRRPLPAVVAVLLNMVVLPLLAWAASQLLDGELALGLVVAGSVPCTVAAAAVWTRLAGGNDAVALMVTMVTNMLCFLVTPAWLIWTVGRDTTSVGSFGQMAGKLALVVVVPIIAAQFLRTVGSVGDWATHNKQRLGVLGQLGILSMVLVGAVRSGQTLAQLPGQWHALAGQIVVMLALVIGLHVAVWFLGYWISKRIGLTRADGLAVAFSGSQKTLMVGLAVALEFGGLAVLPMLAYHSCQLMIDTLLADWQRNRQS